MEIQDNKVTYLVALLVLILIVGIGVLSYNMDFDQGTSGKAVNVPKEADVVMPSSAGAKVSLNLLPNPAEETGGGE